MKKTFLKSLFFVVLGLFVCVSCGTKNTPEAVAESFIKEFKAMNFNAMKKLASTDYISELDESSAQYETIKSSPEKKEFMDELKKQDLKVQPAEISEDGQSAKVRATYSDNEQEGAWKLSLVKEGKDWKVDNISIK